MLTTTVEEEVGRVGRPVDVHDRAQRKVTPHPNLVRRDAASMDVIRTGYSNSKVIFTDVDVHRHSVPVPPFKRLPSRQCDVVGNCVGRSVGEFFCTRRQTIHSRASKQSGCEQVVTSRAHQADLAERSGVPRVGLAPYEGVIGELKAKKIDPFGM